MKPSECIDETVRRLLSKAPPSSAPPSDGTVALLRALAIETYLDEQEARERRRANLLLALLCCLDANTHLSRPELELAVERAGRLNNDFRPTGEACASARHIIRTMIQEGLL